MASLPKIRRILKEDYKDAPAWFDKLIFTLNMFFDSVYNALNQNLKFGDNVTAQIKEFTVTAGATADLNTAVFTLSIAQINGIILLSVVQQGTATVLTSAVSIPSWRVISGQMYIDSITGLTSGKIYTIKVMVI
jgi:hypothetical protein